MNKFVSIVPNAILRGDNQLLQKKMSFFRCFRGRHLRVLCVAGGIPVLTIPTVYAADTEGRKVKISELPMYEVEEEQTKYRYEEAPKSSFHEAVSTVRQAVWDYMDSVQDTTQMITNKFEVGKAHSSELLHYIQDDPSILPKVGVITVAGLGGIVAGYKGGVLRKMILSGSAMTAATALCYPNQAVALSTQTYDAAYSYAISMWEGDSGLSKSSTPSEPKKQTSIASSTVDKSLEDYGQSKAEDKDMYTTRGS